ncbi:hypothetical protein ACJMK2_010942 [Sinanodonta woodiana]|uniref:Uncharacterized protein n=1 Tax=Sinanodonta woodiana TaxID=1069815 RepID=A0ABD3V572_SINWO
MFSIPVILLLSIATATVKCQCPGVADVIIAVPGSDTVPGQEFFPFEQFLIKLVSFFQISEDQFNIGLIIYGKEAVAISWPQPFKTRAQTNTRITLMSQRKTYANKLDGGNDVAAAINLMRQMFSDPSGYPLRRKRNGAKKIGIVFTYGPAGNYQLVIEAARKAKAEGVVMFAIGKGTGREFPEIATDYCKLFSMGRFIDGLPSVLSYLGSSICTELDPMVNVTTQNCFPVMHAPKEDDPVHCVSMSSIFQDPSNCAYYYHCLYMQPVREKCPPEMLFEPMAFNCNYKEAVSCYTNIICPKNEGLFPHPTDCNKFVNCFDFIPYVQMCPSGLRYNAAIKSCDEPRKVTCPVYKRT